MANTTPYTYDLVTEALNDIYEGAVAHPEIELKQNTTVVILGNRTVLVGTPAGPGGIPAAVPGLKDQWNINRDAKLDAGRTYRAALAAGRELLMTAIDAMRPKFGRRWNSEWMELGFVEGSLAVKENPAAQLEQFSTYLALHPAEEVTDMNELPVTAATCLAAAQLINSTQAAYHLAQEDAGQARLDLQVGLNAARNRIIGTRNELDQLLPPDDLRWLAFGFELPAHIETPATPEGFTAVSTDPGEVRGECDETDRADSYRFVIRNPALPVEENVLVDEIIWEPLFIAPGLVSGMTVTVEVSARNITGESQFTAPITVVVA